jgi:hypothetical protein
MRKNYLKIFISMFITIQEIQYPTAMKVSKHNGINRDGNIKK